jgi:hypothetical protein
VIAIYPIGDLLLLIDNKFFNILFSLLFFVTIAAAQERPDVIKKIMDKNIRDQSVTIVKDLTTEEKIFYWKNKFRNSDGYIETIASDDYLNLIESMLAISKKKADIFSNRFSKQLVAKDILSELIESPNRSNYFIDSPTGVVMLTIWDFVADEAKILLLKDFLNVKIFHSTATLVLIKNENSLNKQLWKLSWINKNIQYELYVPDAAYAPNKSTLKRDDVLNLAKRIVNTK